MWSASCMRSVTFLVEPQNQGQWFVRGLDSKPLGRFLLVWPQNGGDGFSWFGLKNGDFRFPCLDLKTGSYGLVIWHTKSPRQFLGLGIKTKQTMVCRLCHKIDGRMKTVLAMCQDVVACFICKQVRLEFPSLASRLVEAWCGWCLWHHHGGCVRIKLKTDGLMRWAASDPSTLALPFLLY
jgi:hypothetical protein